LCQTFVAISLMNGRHFIPAKFRWFRASGEVPRPDSSAHCAKLMAFRCGNSMLFAA
jgi:hypothetical protein